MTEETRKRVEHMAPGPAIIHVDTDDSLVLCTEPVFKDGGYVRCGVCGACKRGTSVDRTVTYSQRALLNDSEQAAMDHITSVMQRIFEWGLAANEGELAQAVHVLQGFVIQHMLTRVEPEHWGNWYVGAIAKDVGAASPAHEAPLSSPRSGTDREGERTGTDGALRVDTEAAPPTRSDPDWRVRAYHHADALVELINGRCEGPLQADEWLAHAQDTIGLDQMVEPRHHGAMAASN